MGAVLKLRDVRHTRGGRDVLGIDELHVQSGERLAVLGPNGAGKTRCSASSRGSTRPRAARSSSTAYRSRTLASTSGRRIGYATQRAGLLSTTVIER